MAKLLASDVNQDGKRQAVTVHGLVSEDSFWDAQCIGGENKPRVIALLRPCENTGDCSFCNRNSIFVPVISPASHNLHNFGDQQSAILVVGHNSVKAIKCRGNVCWIDGLRAYHGSSL